MAAAFRLPSRVSATSVTKFVMEGRKRTGLAWEDSGEIYSDKLKQLRTLRGCLRDHSQHSFRLSPAHRPCARVFTPSLSLNCRSTAAFIRSPRQLLQSDTGDPHFALDPLTYRCLLSLSPAADFAEPRPPRHTKQINFTKINNTEKKKFKHVNCF